MLSFMIFIENSAIERKLVFTSKTCKIWTTWPILMKFWYKKRQSMLFKGQSVWNPRYVASLGKSLTESGISGWWPGNVICWRLMFLVFPVFSRVHATLQPTLSVCRSVGLSVTLSFFSPFYVIISHFKLFKVNSSQFTFSFLVFWSFSLLV